MDCSFAFSFISAIQSTTDFRRRIVCRASAGVFPPVTISHRSPLAKFLRVIRQNILPPFIRDTRTIRDNGSTPSDSGSEGVASRCLVTLGVALAELKGLFPSLARVAKVGHHGIELVF